MRIHWCSSTWNQHDNIYVGSRKLLATFALWQKMQLSKFENLIRFLKERERKKTARSIQWTQWKYIKIVKNAIDFAWKSNKFESANFFRSIETSNTYLFTQFMWVRILGYLIFVCLFNAVTYDKSLEMHSIGREVRYSRCTSILRYE